MTNKIDTWQELPKTLLAHDGKLYPAHWRIDVQCPPLNIVRKWSRLDVDQPAQMVQKLVTDVIEACTRIVNTSTNEELSPKNIYEHDKMAVLYAIFDKFNTENKRDYNVFTEGNCQSCRKHYDKLIVGPNNFQYSGPDSKYDEYIDSSRGVYVFETKDYGTVEFKPSTIGIGEKMGLWIDTLSPTFVSENLDVIETVQATCTDYTTVDNKVLRNKQVSEYNLWSDNKKLFYLQLLDKLTIRVKPTLQYECNDCLRDFQCAYPDNIISKEMFIDVQSFDDQLSGQLDMDSEEHIDNA